MDVILAAGRYEEFVREHSPLMAALFLVLLGLLVVRLVVKMITRAMLLGILLLVAMTVYIERHSLRDCTETCECSLVTVDVDVPFCNPPAELAA